MLAGTSQTSRSRLSSGTRLNGIYEVDHLIAAGGMGEVYKGHTVQTGDPVAIKVLLPDLAENDAALGLFRREASALHNLQHEAIVRYYVFTIEPGLRRPYLAMEFVEGQSLSELVRREPLTYEAVCALAKRVAAEQVGFVQTGEDAVQRVVSVEEEEDVQDLLVEHLVPVVNLGGLEHCQHLPPDPGHLPPH